MCQTLHKADLGLWPQGSCLSCTYDCDCACLQDFKTGYYTLASPKALFVSQLAGAFCGVLVAPGIYKFYTTSFPIGIPGTQYSVPFATVYRLMSVVSANGFHDLPDYCLAIGGACCKPSDLPLLFMAVKRSSSLLP